MTMIYILHEQECPEFYLLIFLIGPELTWSVVFLLPTVIKD